MFTSLSLTGTREVSAGKLHVLPEGSKVEQGSLLQRTLEGMRED